MRRIELRLAGCKYYANAAKRVRCGQYLQLVAEPDNQYDANAIAVYGRGQVGYLPRGADRTEHMLCVVGMCCSEPVDIWVSLYLCDSADEVSRLARNLDEAADEYIAAKLHSDATIERSHAVAVASAGIVAGD